MADFETDSEMLRLVAEWLRGEQNGVDPSVLYEHATEESEVPHEYINPEVLTHYNPIRELKDTHEKTIKDLESMYQQALSEKQAEVDAAKAEVHGTLKRMHQMSAQTKNFAEKMKTMQIEMQQMTETIKSLNELNYELTRGTAEASSVASPSEPTGFEDFFNDPSNWTEVPDTAESPTSTESSNFAESPNSTESANFTESPTTSESSNFTESPTPTVSSDFTDPSNFNNGINSFNFSYEPFAPAQPPNSQNPAQEYFYGTSTSTSTSPPLTPTSRPNKKRKATKAGPFIGQFYQCRQLYDFKASGVKGKEAKDGTTLFCGVINNQVMAGGKNGGEGRQRCVSKVCRKYTDVKDKHWVDDWVVQMYGVGGAAPVNCPKLETTMEL
ncbi:hypothetical protein BKA64DRAFT_435871 [Cadophora sp. MPI-SDFR-AT-0126]|nr:hypothetical protein BKA64DRAFT_435871 [Leotiomycetes sp. MPI-SDFR-AT-0126]